MHFCYPCLSSACLVKANMFRNNHWAFNFIINYPHPRTITPPSNYCRTRLLTYSFCQYRLCFIYSLFKYFSYHCFVSFWAILIFNSFSALAWLPLRTIFYRLSFSTSDCRAAKVIIMFQQGLSLYVSSAIHCGYLL